MKLHVSDRTQLERLLDVVSDRTQLERLLDVVSDRTQLERFLDVVSAQLEVLIGDRIGQHSIRINNQYRICFIWNSSGANQVEIVDYH